jgi:hypothetical protein
MPRKKTATKPASKKSRARSTAAASDTPSREPTSPVWPPNSAGAAAPAAVMKPKWTPEQAQAKMTEWYALRERIVNEVKPLTDAEMALRKDISLYFKPDGHEEGTINIELGAGWVLRLGYGIDRKYDEAAMTPVFEKLPAELQKMLIRWKPEVVVDAYKDLPQETRQILDQCVVAKPKAPTVELVPPKAE